MSSIQLFNSSNENVRILVAQQERLAGKNTERWDGCDDNGNLLPAGTYAWRGIYHEPIKPVFRFSAHNSGHPPYPTADGKGGWGGDHGVPQDVYAFEDGLLMAWHSSEYGWGVIRTDFNGRKVWGCNYDAVHITTDGKTVFMAGGRGFTKGEGVQLVTLDTARPVQLGGSQELHAPAGGDKTNNVISGLAYGAGTLYTSYEKRDLIARFNPTDGALLGTLAVPAPQRLAAIEDGNLLVISQGKLLRVAVDGTITILVETLIDDPQSVATDADGNIYIANRGELSNISIFDADGKYLRAIGKTGGRPAVGRYEQDGVYMAGGIAVDKKGQLWVAEAADSPKRISLWDTTSGTLKNEFFGGSSYFAYGNIDPARPDELLAHNVIWKIDWDKYTVTPETTIWRKTQPDMMSPLGTGSYIGSPRIMTASNGRQYMFGHNYAHFSGVFYRDGDLFRPIFSKIYVGYAYIGPAGIPFMDDDRETYPQGQYFWQDQNADGSVQPEEVLPLKGTPIKNFQVQWVFPDLSVLVSGYLMKPVSIENGVPRYDLSKLEKYDLPTASFTQPLADGGIINYRLGNDARISLAGYNAKGERLWGYRGITRWESSLNRGVTGPGKLWGMTGLMGLGGDYLAYQAYFGVNHIFRRDGIYVGAILKDARLQTERGAYEGQPEGQGGSFCLLNIDDQQRYFAIGGGQDVRVWEVLGLDTIKDLPGGSYEHTPELAAKAEAALRAYQDALLADRKVVIGTDIETANVAERELEGGQGFKIRMARDKQNLIVAYDVVAKSGLINAEADPQLLFKGGNCIDLQLINSRGEPVRILITRYNGKPFAALYFPKLANFEGEPIVLRSPTGSESFDKITFLEDISLEYAKTDGGFSAVAAIPLAQIGLELTPGQKVKMDAGYIFGNAKGMGKAVRRAYLRNNSFSANVTDDIPNESRLEPKEWPEAEVE